MNKVIVDSIGWIETDPPEAELAELHRRLKSGRYDGKGYRITAEAEDAPAELFIYGYIGNSIYEPGVDAEEVVKDLAELDASEIVVRINSPGGDAFGGVAIFNALRKLDADVITEVDGTAASAASIIFMAGGERRMGLGTQLMIHEASGGVMGRARDLRVYADLLDSINQDMAGIYMAAAGGDRAEWMEALSATTWYTGEAALEAGLATLVEVAEPAEEFEMDMPGTEAVSVADVLAANEGAVGPDEAAAPYIPTAEDPEPEPEAEGEEEDDGPADDAGTPPTQEAEPVSLGGLTAAWTPAPKPSIADYLTNERAEA